MSEFDELQRDAEKDELRRVLYTTQRELRKAKERTASLVGATHNGAMEALLALGPLKPIPTPKRDRRKAKDEVALWHLTDWQGSKVTPAYNSQIMRARILNFCEHAGEITEIQRAHHPVRHCLIMLGGDLIEGLFNYPAQPYEIDAGLFDQYAQAGRLLIEVVRYALTIYETVEVIGEWGNHGRLGSKRAVVPRSDNVDRMVMHLAASIIEASGEKRVQWHPPSAEDVHKVVVGNYRAVLFHGDEVGRNGYASPMTIVNHVAKWQSGSLILGGERWSFRDAYYGHYHNHAEWPLPNGLGAVYQSGSPEADNRYAGISMAASATPSQRLHFIDPRKGRVTAQYKVWLEDEVQA